MKPFTREDLQNLLAKHAQPCVSILLPMQRHAPASHENQIRFKKAVKTVEAALAQKPEYKAGAPEILTKLATLDRDETWAQNRDALAVYCSPEFLAWWTFAETMPETVAVSDSFFTKPLLKYLQGEVRYYVLALTKDNVTLFEGGRESLDPVHVPGMPRGMRELESKAHGQGVAVRSTSGHGTVHFGTSGSEDDGKQDLRAMFRLVDRALLPLTHDQRVPLILATFDHYHGLFHEVSKNPALLDERIEGDPERMSREQIRDRALAMLTPRRTEALKAVAEAYGVAVARHRGTNYLPNIAKAATQGRVQTMLIEDGRHVPGRLDRATGDVSSPRTAEDASTDLLDDVAELVLAAGGNVYVLPKSLMPTDVGAAAIYRY